MNEVKKDEHYIADLAYGSSDARHMWAESKEDQASALYFDANFEDAFKIDDISSVFHYELLAKNGGLNSYMTEEGKGEILCSDFDGILNEDKLTNIPLAVSISHASEDHYLDVDFDKKVPDLDCKFYDELSVGNLRSEIHSPETSNEEVGVSESSVLVPRCFNDQFGKTAKEMHGDLGSKCRYQMPVEDNMGLKCSLVSDVKYVQATNDDRNTLEIGSSFNDDRDNTHVSFPYVKPPYISIYTHDEVGSASQCTDVDDFCVEDPSTDSCAETKITRARQRRLCRPPQRYLDGTSSLKLRLHNAKKHPSSLLEDKDLGVRSLKKHSRKALEVKASKTWASDMELDSDEEYEPVESSFNGRKFKRNDRRKSCQPWTLDEVVALVDGMSKFGPGQWTAVKKTFFLSSRRTATDIRDKWRNLVKTNCRSSKGKKDDQRNNSHVLPNPVIERVRELASAPPVLRGRGRGGRKLSALKCPDMPPYLAE
ncbi:uncharacterized protein LOC110683658 [Chenopodium quinoa]|nr:uncharacterized protein LOC110683658 [Chenopodium quinoa]